MSGLKAMLKGINDAIRQNKFDEAVKVARELLQKDAKNYQGRVFLAFALDNKNELAEAENVYLAAVATRPQDPQAYQGLVKLYEKQGNGKLAAYQRTVISLARVLADAGEAYKSQDVADKFVDFARCHGSPLEYADALWIRLPESPLYPVLEGRFPQPAQTYETIARIVEDAEKKRINKLIGERRTRLGATLSDVTVEAKREVYGQSRLEHLYRQLINWTADDDVRRTYEEKLLQYCYDRLSVLSPAAKSEQQAVVLGLARDMVVIKHPFKLAWDIAINWQDHKEISDWDAELLRGYRSFFPDADLYKVVTAYLTSSFSPFPEPKKQEETEASAVNSEESEDDDDGGAPTSLPLMDEDRLVMITEGISATESTFAYRLVGHYFLQLGEYETTVEYMRRALQYLYKERTTTGLDYQNTQDAYSLCLATALVYYQSPRHHQEAKALFDGVLEHDETRTSALIGVGLIYEEEQEYDQAIDFLSRALERDGSNLRVKTEAAWIKALKGDWQTAKDELMSTVEPLEAQGAVAKELLADTQHRVGCCMWNLDTDRQARKQKKGDCAYSYWLAALGNNMKLAPAYTSLGVYYRDYAKDRKRARRCFQKALELSSAEVISAQSLAQSFAEDADWERVELVARRVVDSGVVKPPPGSKRKGISWPFSALGVAELNKQDFHKAIVSFQSALKLSPDDYHSWVGLGESYHSSGRYVAATKAILNAQGLQADGRDVSVDTWFTKYMLANIKRELGEYDEAVALYRSVLESRPAEEGVILALTQTMAENALVSVEKGFFGKAIELAIDTIDVAASTTPKVRGTFNFWKSVAEACSIFTSVHSRAADFPTQAMRALLEAGDQDAYRFLANVDKVGTDVVCAKGIYSEDEQSGVDRTRCVHSTILCHKQAIYVSSGDQHAQAVAHYNLGWAEHRAHVCLPYHLRRKPSSYLRAAVRAFKRSIELESGNAEFWNALGVATSEINPAVSQHALVRSLHLNERSPAAWTNLGTLALLSRDLKLANEAYTRAQSADPDYAHAWLGQAFIALLVGDVKEARSLFTHAMDIAEASSLPSRQHYAASAFDHVLSGAPGTSAVSLIQPLFALGQVGSLRPQELVFTHLATLFQERTRDSTRAIRTLEGMCGAIEADYETTESAESLVRFTLAKADLARAYLAGGSYDQAVECGETALGLSGEEGEGELTGEQRKRARLSAQLTTGLGHFFLGAYDEAEKGLEAALEESNGSPDAACLLAQALWAQGSEDSRQRARAVLLDVVETRPEHTQSVLLLGAVALLDEDEAGLEAVAEALHGLRASDGVTTVEQGQVGDVMGAMAMAGAVDDDSREDEMLAQLQADIMLRPHLPDGWGSLAETTGDGHAAAMALRVAARGIPPRGALEAEQLARAHAGTGMAADSQRAVVVAPWAAAGWEALRAITEGI